VENLRATRRQLALAYLAGARPNFMKLAPVVSALRERAPEAKHVLIHTGQHYDPEMSDIFIQALDLPQPDYFLGVGSGTHGAQVARALERVESVLEQQRPDVLVVAGDVNSTLAGALAAAKLNIPVAHVESGLRSFDRTMPEEINRLLVDQLARWCFTHSAEAEENLLAEGVGPERVFFVGNTMIDSLVRMLPRAARCDVHRRLGIERGGYVLVTLHRPKLVDGPLLEPAFQALRSVARDFPVVFPVHPRVRQRLNTMSTDPRVLLLEPIGYVDFLALEANAAGVITDSGGVQEETTHLGIPCFTVRDNTERPITVTHGTNILLGLRAEAIESVPALLKRPRAVVGRLPGWDGKAAQRIADALLAEVGRSSSRIAASTKHVGEGEGDSGLDRPR
jgi:UDP-N-acetylglucosamine 2-epimerase (non-hydrolysing)